jgi:hypothetical protein
MSDMNLYYAIEHITIVIHFSIKPKFKKLNIRCELVA